MGLKAICDNCNSTADALTNRKDGKRLCNSCTRAYTMGQSDSPYPLPEANIAVGIGEGDEPLTIHGSEEAILSVYGWLMENLRLKESLAECEKREALATSAATFAANTTESAVNRLAAMQSRLDLATGLLRDLAVKAMDTPGFVVKHSRAARAFLSQAVGEGE